MPRVLFRPHKLRIVTKGEGSYDKNGDWVEGSGQPTYSAYIPCRYEPNGSANTITLPDGTAYKYSYTIYLSVNPSISIQYGSIIELTSQDGIVIAPELEVKGFHRGQLNMKVWV
jgi:hypothetical protein